MKNSNVLPGMACSSIEIFVVENVVKAIHAGKVKDFSELPGGVVELLKEEINKDENVKLALHQMQPLSDWKRLEQFAKCRFGGLDYNADIKNGELQDGEFWDCPNRGTCIHEGILCKLPIVNNHRLEQIEVKLLQLTATDMTNDVIAEELNIPLGTLHKIKKYFTKFFEFKLSKKLL